MLLSRLGRRTSTSFRQLASAGSHTRTRDSHREEAGQALVIFAAGLIAFLGLVAMSIDVGRLVWARTQMQAAVDAAALAAAQSMPDQTMAAAKAEEYWLDNSGFIRSADPNAKMTVTYPQGNKAISVRGEAKIPTYFARIFGINEWNVSAEGDAESQVLDIAVVLDISGSMCWNSYPKVDNGQYMSPGRTASIPRLAQPIAAGGANSIVIKLNSVAIFNSTSSSTNNTNFGYNTSTRYWQYSPGGARAGLIMIGDELMQITALNAATNELTVTRARQNLFTGQWTAKTAHPANSEVWAHRSNCNRAGYSAPPAGPYEPFDGMIDDAKYFTTLFNPQYDKIGLATYSSNGTLRRNLTDSFSTVRADMDGIANPDGGTNSAYGLALGRRVLDGTGKRANAVRVLVFLTDGRANTWCSPSTYSSSAYDGNCGSTGSGSDGDSRAESHVFAEVQRLTDSGVVIFTIGLGNQVDDGFLQEVADGGVGNGGPCQTGKPGCRYFKAPTTAQLDDAFASIAAMTHIALVR